MEITNLFNRPLVLRGGTVLAANGTDGATKTVAALHDFDRRLVLRGLVFVAEKAVEKAVEKVVEAEKEKK